MNMQAQLQAAIDAAAASVPGGSTSPGVDVDAHVAVDPCNITSTDELTCAPKRELIKVKELSEKAMLCSLSISTFSAYKRDDEATAEYGAGNVSKHLFASSDNRVKKLNNLYVDMQSYLRKNTVPYAWGKGIYMLAAREYFNITAELREKARVIDIKLNDLVANWNTVVQTDFARLYAIDPKLASYDDYPADIRSKYGHELNFMPVPKPDHFDPRFGMTDADKASLQRQLDEADMRASTHVIKQLMGPMQAAVTHLTKPVEDVKVFHKSLITNMVEVADRMNRANVSDDPAVQKQIDDLSRLASSISTNSVKHDAGVRRTAKSDIETLMKRMEGLV